mmetsp:Transcript_102689/g.320011  ORF Transcript_102689/g.320011 Transcript_102689/m.320011 type:complete len:412 (-) Transcript_102689:65-1300(-)
MAGTELNGVVDEDDVAARYREEQRDRKKWDWDRICSYRTPKVVRIRDKYLGAFYWSMVTFVIMYFIIYVFHVQGMHSQQENGVGTVITKFSGKGFAGDKVFDGPDLRYPIIDPSGAFIMTRRIVVTNQTFGSCVDWDNPKKCPCPANSTCTNGYCEVRGWCPSIGDKNADSPPQGALVEDVLGLEKSTLKIASAIAFPSIGNKFFVTGTSPGATNQFKSIKLGALLGLADPPIYLKDLPRGALIGVNFFWNCDVVFECEPTPVIKRLDGGQGFVLKRAWHSRTGGKETREAAYMFGLRILVDSAGIGRRVSWPLIVIQLGSCLALLRLAATLADWVMLKLPQERQEAYNRCKVETTEDFSDLQDRLNLVRNSENVLAQRQRTSGGGRATLGLGTGGRGGSPTTILRGRSVG